MTTRYIVQQLHGSVWVDVGACYEALREVQAALVRHGGGPTYRIVRRETTTTDTVV